MNAQNIDQMLYISHVTRQHIIYAIEVESDMRYYSRAQCAHAFSGAGPENFGPRLSKKFETRIARQGSGITATRKFSPEFSPER